MIGKEKLMTAIEAAIEKSKEEGLPLWGADLPQSLTHLFTSIDIGFWGCNDDCCSCNSHDPGCQETKNAPKEGTFLIHLASDHQENNWSEQYFSVITQKECHFIKKRRHYKGHRHDTCEHVSLDHVPNWALANCSIVRSMVIAA